MPLGDLGEPGVARAQREERHEREPLTGAVIDHVLVPALLEVVVVLDHDDRHDGACPLDLVDTDLRDADVLDLALVAEPPDLAEALLKRGLRIDAVQVVQRDAVGAQGSQALLDLRPQHRGAPLARTEPALCRDERALATGRERRADRPLALAARVQVGGVDRLHAGLDSRSDESGALAGIGEPVGAQPGHGSRPCRRARWSCVRSSCVRQSRRSPPATRREIQ